MLNQKINADIWTGLGVTSWTTRPGFALNSQDSGNSAESNPADTPINPDVQHEPLGELPCTPKWILIGSGLSQIWQQPDQQTWSLWQAIIAFHVGAEQGVLYYDTDLLQTEQAMFDVVEHMIELGVEQVFSMDAEHEINEMLAEGLQLVPIPSLDAMLEQPSLKRVLYERLCHVHSA